MTKQHPTEPLRVVLGEWQTEEAFHRALTAPVELVPAQGVRDDQIAPLIADADILISRRFTQAMAQEAHRLRLILTPGAGTNEIDFDAVPAGASVCNVYGHEIGIAEYVFMTMLALNRDLLNMDHRFRQGNWTDRANGPQRELNGTTLALVGLGRIGSEISRRAAIFGMRTIAVTRSPDAVRKETLGLDFLGDMSHLHRVLAEAGFVVLAVPLEEETTDLLGQDELGAMKPGACLVNVARGPVVNEDALYNALRARTIAGAALDVWYHYPDNKVSGPPSRHPFHELDNVILTPHIAGWTFGTFGHRWRIINENIQRLADGEPLINVVRN